MGGASAISMLGNALATNSQGANLVQSKLAVVDGELMNSIQSNKSLKSQQAAEAKQGDD